MKWQGIEFIVGLFMLAGLLSFTYFAINLGGVVLSEEGYYGLRANFVSASGLKQGADVEIAGVVIGKVTAIDFDSDNYEARVTLIVANHVKLQDDAIASIRSTGILGGKFIKITPGASDTLLAEGDEIIETESSVNLEELISKYIFESANKSDD